MNLIAAELKELEKADFIFANTLKTVTEVSK